MDVVCGGMPTPREINLAIHDVEVRRGALNFQRIVLHIDQIVAARYRTHNVDDRMRDERVRFCLGDISEQRFKTKVQRIEKDSMKRREIALVLDMVVPACSDLFRQILPRPPERARSAEDVGC